jgi:dolichol-phosphate mannosyltransferase
MYCGSKVLIITPTYNEKDNLEGFAQKVVSLSKDFHLLIMDDNSPDGTGQIADQLAQDHEQIKVIHRPKKMGLGTAYIEGFNYALKNNYDLIFEIDADFSHDPADIPRFLEEIKNGADLVIGSRYKNGISVVNWPLSRLIISLAANKFAIFLAGLSLTDTTSGFKCFRRQVLEKINLERIKSNGYAFQIETNFCVHKLGFKIKEIPIVFVERSEGKSKMTKRIIWETFFLVWQLWWKRLVNFHAL